MKLVVFVVMVVRVVDAVDGIGSAFGAKTRVRFNNYSIAVRVSSRAARYTHSQNSIHTQHVTHAHTMSHTHGLSQSCHQIGSVLERCLFLLTIR